MLCYSSCTLIELETEHMFIYIKNLVDGVHDTAAHSGKEMRTCLKHFENLFVVKSRSSWLKITKCEENKAVPYIVLLLDLRVQQAKNMHLKTFFKQWDLWNVLLGLSVSLSLMYDLCNKTIIWENNILFLLSFGFMFSSAFTTLNSLEKVLFMYVWISQHELFHIDFILLHLASSKWCFYTKDVIFQNEFIFTWFVCLQLFQRTSRFRCAFSYGSAKYWLDWLFVLWLAQDHLAPFALFVWMLTHTKCISVYGLALYMSVH